MNHAVTEPASPRRPAWPRWILLAVILAGFWFSQSRQRAASHPEVDYSTAYGWIEQGKIASVVLKGRDAKAETPLDSAVAPMRVAASHVVPVVPDAGASS